MNHGLLTERALRNVFEITSYISFGTADDPFPYPIKAPKRSAFYGKQIQSHTPKLGFQTNDVFFQKEHPWVFDGDLYVDRNMYIQAQPERFKGFLSSDFSKMDEFSSVCRTEQYRTQLKMEEKHGKRSIAMAEETMKKLKEQYPQLGKHIPTRFDGPQFQYDVGRAGLATTKHCSKCHKQTYYCQHNIAYCNNNPTLVKESGDYPTASNEYGSTAATASYAKPPFARKPIVRDTFYRKTNIFFPKKQPTGFLG